MAVAEPLQRPTGPDRSRILSLFGYSMREGVPGDWVYICKLFNQLLMRYCVHGFHRNPLRCLSDFRQSGFYPSRHVKPLGNSQWVANSGVIGFCCRLCGMRSLCWGLKKQGTIQAAQPEAKSKMSSPLVFFTQRKMDCLFT